MDSEGNLISRDPEVPESSGPPQNQDLDPEGALETKAECELESEDILFPASPKQSSPKGPEIKKKTKKRQYF